MDQPQQQNVSQAFKEYKWYNSSSLSMDVQVGISRLELPADIKVSAPEVPQDLYFTAHVVCNQMPMHESPVCSFFSNADDGRNCLVWDYVMTFPLKTRDLSADAILVLTAWTPEGRIFGGTTMNFFDELGSLKRGKQKLMFYFGTVGDSNSIRALNTTPGENYNHFAKWDYRFELEKDLETYGTSLSTTSRTRNDAKNEWLDRLTFAQIQACLDGRGAPEDNNPEAKYVQAWGRSPEELELENYCFLVVDLPLLQYPVLHEEKQYPTVAPHIPPNSQMEMLSSLISEETDAVIEFSLVGRPFNASFLTIVADWDMDQDNLAEDQNRRLCQHSRRGAVDATAKPNRGEKERIDKLISAVSNHMTTEDIDLLYQFRYSLTENKRALIKFMYSVNWDEESEVAEVPTLLALWNKNAPIDVADALKLLSKERCFEHAFVREYAVSILRSASDDELLTFLLQLVQALRYEPSPTASAGQAASPGAVSAPVVDFALESSMVGINHLDINARLSEAVGPADLPPRAGVATVAVAELALPSARNSLSPLANFLIDRACSSPTVANYLYCYLKVETEDEQAGALFQSVFDAFTGQLSTSGAEGKMLYDRLYALDDYISKISTCQRDAREQGRRKEGKEQCLRQLLDERQLKILPNGLDWVPMPLDPSIQLMGLIPNTAAMFASAVYPCVIEFVDYRDHQLNTATAAGSASTKGAPAPRKTLTHKIMFKSGDDLRQDQLIMQMIALMDRLLKKVNLDLKLLTYGILAVSQKDGIMEFCRNSMPISAVLKNFNNSISDYLRHHNHEKGAPGEIAPVALDTFIKSCAGYCVITYILGIGDRHLDNIMINTSGQMFHIDFGFIFGQDPKPMPPPFRFIRAMADAMGGEEGENYARFKTFCCQSYNWLRKSANLILNLLSLMGDAGIQDISKRSDLPKVLMKVEEKFRLDLTDEQAEQYFLGLINEALYSLAPRLMEVAHKFAVAMR